MTTSVMHATHQPRLWQAAQQLLTQQRVAALATTEADGSPFVSMVPFALETEQHSLVIHVSGLAQHTRNMLLHPRVSLMIMQAEQWGQPVHALSRLTVWGQVLTLETGSPMWHVCRHAYLQRFPEAEPMTQLADFQFLSIGCLGARQVAGFGAAKSIDAHEWQQMWMAFQTQNQ